MELQPLDRLDIYIHPEAQYLFTNIPKRKTKTLTERLVEILEC